MKYFICFINFEQYAKIIEEDEEDTKEFVITELKHEMQTTAFQFVKIGGNQIESSETEDHALITSMLLLWNDLPAEYKTKENRAKFNQYAQYHTGSAVCFK